MKPPEGMTIEPRPRLWCLTHDCWDGDCGVLGQHEVEPRHAATLKGGPAKWRWTQQVGWVAVLSDGTFGALRKTRPDRGGWVPLYVRAIDAPDDITERDSAPPRDGDRDPANSVVSGRTDAGASS